jgi:glycosyltransferase involved in cell wall biosynthesis
MRICYVAFQFWPSVGGSQSQAEKQARYLQKSGQDVLVVTLRHQKSWRAYEEYSSFPIIRIGGLYKHDGTLRAGRFGHLFSDLLLFLTLWRLRQSYDLIHTLQLSPLAAVAALVGHLTHKPVIIGIQNTGPYDYVNEVALQEEPMPDTPDRVRKMESVPSTMYKEVGGDIAFLVQTAWGGRRMLNYLRKSNAYYQILSSRSYPYLMQHGFRPEQIVHIPNGIDTQQFYPVLWQGEALPPRERALFCIARLEYAKGIDILLRAWAYMLALPAGWRDGIKPRLCLVGDGSRRAELEQMVVELGIQESVDFLGTRHDIAWLLQESWGFVLPSRWEGMPNALLEAMACGLPCIATRVSGSEDIIEQGINGLLVPPEQPEGLAYALRLVLEDTRLARQLGWRGYETVLRYYQLSSTVQSCLAFYSYLLARRHFQQDVTGYDQSSGIYPEEWQRYE